MIHRSRRCGPEVRVELPIVSRRSHSGHDSYLVAAAAVKSVRTGRACGGAGRLASTGRLSGMCRNITPLRGLEPPATPDEIEAAARQYVRKVSGITHPAPATGEAFEQAVAAIAHVTAGLLHELPPRRQPPKTVPPLRRPEVRARLERSSAR